MAKVKCPKCNEEFEISESAYAEVLSNVKEEEIDKRVKQREDEIKKTYDALSKSNIEKETSELNKRIAVLEKEIEQKDNEKKSSIDQAKSELNNEIIKLKGELKNKDLEKDNAVKDVENNLNKKISSLNEQISRFDSEAKLKLNETVTTIKNNAEKEKQELIKQVEYYKDFQRQMDVKLLGESLEQYCENEFNKIRTTCYPNCEFGKDNDIKINDKKADYIFRDYVFDEQGNKVEVCSIIFDMKHEHDETESKQKNEKYFKKLNDDRETKHCDYAVLVSTLEADNRLYNGITDVSYLYKNMYVVRPQCFLSIISIIRNLALLNSNAKKELSIYKRQNFDVEAFEAEWTNWKEKFKGNVTKYHSHFDKAIKEIDDSISKLSKVRDELIGAKTQLTYAENKVDDVTIKKLAKNSPSIKEQLKKTE